MLARRLKIVLDNTFWVDPFAISEVPSGAVDDGLASNEELLTTVPVGDRQISIRLQRVALDDGDDVWLFDRATVAAIDELYEEPRFWLARADRLPAFFFTIRFFEVELWQLIAVVLLLEWVGQCRGSLSRPLMAALKRGAANTSARWDDELAKAVRGPLRMGLFAFVIFFGTQCSASRRRFKTGWRCFGACRRSSFLDGY